MTGSFTLRFDFWGARTDLTVPTDADKAHFAYYFSDYFRQPNHEAHVAVELATGNASAYIASRPDDRRVVITSRVTGETQMFTADETVHAPTPLPPFGYEPLVRTISTVHAAAVAHPSRSDSALLVHGPSTSGKSTLLVGLVDRGWTFISDDTVPIDRHGRALPFTRPIGIRERTAEQIVLRDRHLPAARRFMTTLGLTTSVHPRELGWRVAEPSTVRWIVEIQPDQDFQVLRRTEHHLRMSLDIARHHERALDQIERFCRGA